MAGNKIYKVLNIVLAGFFSAGAFAQQFTPGDSLLKSGAREVMLKPRFSYSAGSSLLYIPRLGTVTGFNLTPSLSLPVSPKLRLEGGIIAGRFYPSLRGFGPDGLTNRAFNSLAIYGSAIYQLNPRLSIYGSGMKQVTGTSPFTMLPGSSYSLGSTYRSGSFSVGVSVEVSDWNNMLSPMPFNGSQGLFVPYGQRLPR